MLLQDVWQFRQIVHAPCHDPLVPPSQSAPRCQTLHLGPVSDLPTLYQEAVTILYHEAVTYTF